MYDVRHKNDLHVRHELQYALIIGVYLLGLKVNGVH